jgi:hypothetical protein
VPIPLGSGKRSLSKDYMVEISLCNKKVLIIAARKQRHYRTELPKKQGKKLI